MADEVTSGEIRTRRFDVVRKGYDRNQVESFLALIARQIDKLESRVADDTNGEIAVGIDDAEALARELASIGGEVDKILEGARSAAEGMRTRAAADVESWTSEADDQTRTVREAAWVEGSAMLAAASEHAESLANEAEADVLRVKSEAEREAIRHTSDAKRASEETVGAAENEAEGILASSRAESERVLRSANQSAEMAQERARALEDRRAELLAELESTRSSIGDLETEIESKRQKLEEPEPAPEPTYRERTHHEPDGGSVRIVSGSKVIPFKPVDADSFVAEVAELHRNRPEESRQPSSVSYQAEEEQEESRQPSSVSYQAEEELGESPQASSVSHQAEEESEASPQAQEELQEEPVVDSIGSLFAQLAEESEPAKDSRQPSAVSPQAEEEEESSPLTVDSEQTEGAESEPSLSRSSTSPPPKSEGESLETVSLIPAQNAALRSIKRLLVDLQNDALEHLRTDKTWVPDEQFTDRFTESFSELADAVAGDTDDGGASLVFATDLYDAVSSAVIAGREAGSGERAIAASTSKVFRTWRSDEAERRVIAVAEGLAAQT